MTKQIGLVLFLDGDKRYFIYNAFSDIAWPELFEKRTSAETAWENYDLQRYDPYAIETAPATDDEPVALYTWADDFGKPEVKPFFHSTASRLATVITGPPTLEDAISNNSYLRYPGHHTAIPPPKTKKERNHEIRTRR